jgi:lipopolysaccharide transport system permease protein
MTTTLRPEETQVKQIISTATYETVQYPVRDPLRLAVHDFMQGLYKWPIWIMLAWQDLRLRYRRSVLGPFWFTLSMAITIYSMGFLYSHLFHTDLQTYFPFLTAGMLGWALVSGLIIDLVEVFCLSDNLIKQISLPYTLYIHRVTARNFMIFFHNVVVIVPVILVFHEKAHFNLYLLLLLPGLFLIYVNAIAWGMVLGMLGGRYRDVPQLIRSVIQIVFFLTPVMWSPASFSAAKQSLILLNPFYAFIELIRAPLLGTAPAASLLVIVAAVTITGLIACIFFMKHYRARIIYWI